MDPGISLRHIACGHSKFVLVMSQPPTASRDPPMLSGQDRVQLSEGSLIHMLELYDEECETRASRDTL